MFLATQFTNLYICSSFARVDWIENTCSYSVCCCCIAAALLLHCCCIAAALLLHCCFMPYLESTLSQLGKSWDQLEANLVQGGSVVSYAFWRVYPLYDIYIYITYVYICNIYITYIYIWWHTYIYIYNIYICMYISK